jgi:hypothetical protein
MKIERYSLLSAAAAAGLIGVGTMTRAATLSQNANAPTSNILASQLTDVGPGTQDGNRDFTDNSGPVGQTFTVPNAALLTAMTVLGRGDSGNLAATSNFHIKIGVVNSATGAITQLSQETAPEVINANNDYLTFNLATPVPVAPGNTYAFSIYSEAGWYGLAHSSTDVYANGTAINDNLTTDNPDDNSNGIGKNAGFGGVAAPNPLGYDYVFVAQGGVPEPASLGVISLGGLWMLRRRRRC